MAALQEELLQAANALEAARLEVTSGNFEAAWESMSKIDQMAIQIRIATEQLTTRLRRLAEDPPKAKAD